MIANTAAPASRVSPVFYLKCLVAGLAFEVTATATTGIYTTGRLAWSNLPSIRLAHSLPKVTRIHPL